VFVCDMQIHRNHLFRRLSTVEQWPWHLHLTPRFCGKRVWTNLEKTTPTRCPEGRGVREKKNTLGKQNIRDR